MAFATGITGLITRFTNRNSVRVATVMAGAFVFQASFDSAVTCFYEEHNKGKLWKDVKTTIGASEEEEDDE